MFVTNWISTTKIQKISEITNFFRHYFLSRTEVLVYYMAMHFVLCHDAQTSTSPCNFKDIGSFKKACYYLILAPNDFTNLIFLPFAMIGFFHSPPKIRITAFLPTGTASTAFCKSMKLPRPSAETT